MADAFEVLTPGHAYAIPHKDGPGSTIIQFVSRAPLHKAKPGILNQDLLRVVIDRLGVLEAEVPWEGNKLIIHHLRMAIALHEARAFLRHVEKGQILPERLPTGADGHMIIQGAEHEEAPHD